MTDRGPHDDDWMFDPGLASLNRSLKREMREEAEEVESIVAESELRARTFADVALEHRNRGEFVGVTTSRRTFNGQVVYAAGDFVTVRTDSFEVDINLADVSYMRMLEITRRGGMPGEEGPGTFEMRLMERRSAIERVEVGFCAVDETVVGRIATVGQDHVVMYDDHNREWTVPLTAISYVIRRGRRALK